MKKRQTNAQFLSLLATLSLSFSQLSCSSGSNSAKDVGAKNPVADGPQNDLDAVPDDGPFRSWKYEWESDVSDAKLKPCDAGKPFANGKCYNEVHFTDESITLKSPNETFTFLEAGKPLTPFVLEHYVFSKEDGGDFILINERLASINSRTGFLQRYWFLPSKIRVSKTEDKRDLSKAVFLAAEFPLAMSYGSTKTDQFGFPESIYFKGSISLCGKTVPLPLTQKTIESTCDYVLGSGGGFGFQSAYGRTLLEIEVLETTLPERRAHWMAIGNTDGLRGSL
jgi:hypothetical protein